MIAFPPPRLLLNLQGSCSHKLSEISNIEAPRLPVEPQSHKYILIRSKTFIMAISHALWTFSYASAYFVLLQSICCTQDICMNLLMLCYLPVQWFMKDFVFSLHVPDTLTFTFKRHEILAINP